MSFEPYLKEQFKLHPSMQPQDLMKLCFQAAYGAEHLLSDPEAARKYLTEELRAVEAADLPLTEPISDRVLRVNLAAWKYRGLPEDALFELFVRSAKEPQPERNVPLEAFTAAADTYLEKTENGAFASAFRDYVREYLSGGIRPVHHSGIYRASEKPAYRVVSRRFEPDIQSLLKA